MKYLVWSFILLLISACNKADGPTATVTSNLSKIKIENGQFHNEDGTLFFPWGFNYTNPDGVGLLEDNWLDENVWQIIESDFAEMKALGANIVRIHLQYHQFMTDADTPNPVALNRLEDLVMLATDESLYLDITGLAAYRKNDQPAFYTSLSDEDRWATQKIFWESIAARLGDSPAVFAYNLMNEPVVSVGCNTNTECNWTPGEGLDDLHFVQNITRTAGINYANTFRQWIAEMTQAIRTADKETLITVGVLDLGDYSRFTNDLDYLSPHIYPRSDEIQDAIDRLNDRQSNAPIVIEEIYNLFCKASELEDFINGVDGKYNGLMGHYFGTPMSELNDGNINHAIQKNFLDFFIKQNPNK